MGSTYSRTALRTRIHALIYNQGLPSIFLTLNPADIHSPVALYFAGAKLDLDNIQIEQLMTTYKRAEIIASHPVATAKFFHLLITNILDTMIVGGVLGPVKAYFGTVENQGRGSLHLHLLIWLDHDFKPCDLKEKIQNVDFREKLKAYLEDIIKEDLDEFKGKRTFENPDTTNASRNESKTIPACLPTPNPSSPNFASRFCADIVQLVESNNIHKHSDTGYKYWNANQEDKKTCRMRMPRKLVSNSTIDPATGNICMRRCDPWINNFNEYLIAAGRSNMDIKFIWSGSDAKALVYNI
ncbi:unnamed protein product, partial [Rotaria sp. Silwood2]